MLKILLKKLDKLLCIYLGLNNKEIRLNSVRIKNNKIIIINTISFKRHIFQKNWDGFHATYFKQLDKNEREKLGLATSKLLAKDLSLSFEKISIN